MMTAEERERDHLAQSDRHVAECERHIAEQQVRIAKLRAGGHDTAAFDGVLATTLELLAQHRAHRAIILRQIALHETSPSGPSPFIIGDGTSGKIP